MNIHELIRHLSNGQQADADGVFVTVGRHAVVEAIRLLNLLGETNEALAACQSEGAALKRQIAEYENVIIPSWKREEEYWRQTEARLADATAQLFRADEVICALDKVHDMAVDEGGRVVLTAGSALFLMTTQYGDRYWSDPRIIAAKELQQESERLGLYDTEPKT